MKSRRQVELISGWSSAGSVLTWTLGLLLGVEAAWGKVPRPATAEATLEAGYVVGVTLTDPGAGYGVPPTVTLSGGGGSGATAVAKAANGIVEKIVLMSTGSGYSSQPTVVVAPPEMPMLESVRSKFMIGLTIQGRAGETQQISATDVLVPPAWGVLTNILVTSSPYLWVDEAAPVPQRYYQVGGGAEAPMLGSGRLMRELKIRGTVGTTNYILARDEVAPSVWRVLTNAVVTSSPYVWVDEAASPLQRQYRVAARLEVPVEPNPRWWALIEAGRFTMGDTMGDSYEPPHKVSVSAFYMERHEVTKEVWDEVRQWAVGHGYGFDYPGSGKAPNHPVHSVNWYDVVKWCNARSQREGRAPAYYTDAGLTQVYKSGQVAPYVRWNGGYRLPTEAEWEKAARGGLSGKRFPWGDTISHSQANYQSTGSNSYDVSPTRGYHPAYATGSSPYTSPVGSFATNGYGLYDMAGNVLEWCWDWSGSSSSSPASDPRGPASGSARVLRGGSWYDVARDCRVSYRGLHWPVYGNIGFGFRSVLPPGQP